MAKRPKTRQSLEEILASCSDTLFPEEMGKAVVTPNSRCVDGDTPLHVLLWRGNNYAIELLLEAGADVNAIGDMSETPLHIALQKNNLDAVRMLLKAGADKTLRSEFGQTPADIANELGGEFAKIFFPK